MLCELHDLSIGGAFVATDYFGTPGHVVHISFTLPDGTLIECPGRIAWVNRVNSSATSPLRVKFSLLANHAQDALARFINTPG